MISVGYKKFFLCLVMLVSSLNITAFEEAFFAKKGKFSCASLERCHVPSIDEIEWIKNEFKNRSLERVLHLGQFEEKANKQIENILWRSQESELKENSENNLSEFYKNVGSYLDQKFNDMKIETAKVLLSEGSPFIMELEDLQGVLTGVLTQRDKEELSDREKYYNWFNRPSFRQLLKEMSEIRSKFYLKKSVELDLKDKVDLLPFPLITCPTKLKGLIATKFFSSDLNKDIAFYSRVIGVNKKQLKVKCSPVRGKKSGKLKPRYLNSTREIVLPYRVGKRRSVSPVKKMFDNVK